MPNITQNNCLFIVQILLTLINTIKCTETSTRAPDSALKFRIKINKTHFEQQERGRNSHGNDYFDSKFGESSSKHPSNLLLQHKHITEPTSPRVSSHRQDVRIDSPPATNSPREATPTNLEFELRRQQMRRTDSASSITASTTPKGASSSNTNYLIDAVKDEPADDIAPVNGLFFNIISIHFHTL